MGRPRGRTWKSRIHHRSIRNPSRGQGSGRGVGVYVGDGNEVEEAINFTARFIMEPPSIIAAGYARAARTLVCAIINSEKLLIAIMSSFTQSRLLQRRARRRFAERFVGTPTTRARARRVLNYVRFT